MIHIVFDPVGLDLLSLNQGQFRYVRDLAFGIESLAPAAQFTFLGSRPDPAPELAGLFSDPAGRWRYLHLRRPSGRGSMYREQAWISWVLLRLRANLYHNLRGFMPVFAPCPTIATVYDLMREIFPEYAGSVRIRSYRLYRWAIRNRSARLIAISGTTADDIQRLWGVPRSRIDVTFPGTTFTGPTPDILSLPSVPLDAPLIVSPYNLEPRKNLDALIVAFDRVRAVAPSSRLVLYGRAAVTPEREARFRAFLTNYPAAAEAITLTGFLTDDQLAWLYGRADVFAFPSLYEGFGYPVLEAMAAGACVVARGVSSMAEVLGDAGVAIDPIGPDELTAAIVNLLRDDHRRAELGRAARLRAREFTVERMATETLHTYERVLGCLIPIIPAGSVSS